MNFDDKLASCLAWQSLACMQCTVTGTRWGYMVPELQNFSRQFLLSYSALLSFPLFQTKLNSSLTRIPVVVISFISLQTVSACRSFDCISFT